MKGIDVFICQPTAKRKALSLSLAKLKTGILGTD